MPLYGPSWITRFGFRLVNPVIRPWCRQWALCGSPPVLHRQITGHGSGQFFPDWSRRHGTDTWWFPGLVSITTAGATPLRRIRPIAAAVRSSTRIDRCFPRDAGKSRRHGRCDSDGGQVGVGPEQDQGAGEEDQAATDQAEDGDGRGAPAGSGTSRRPVGRC